MRGNYRSKIRAAGTPDPVAEVRNHWINVEEPARTILAQRYVPEGASGGAVPLVLFAHCGGFVAGDLETHAHSSARIQVDAVFVIAAREKVIGHAIFVALTCVQT